MKGARKALFVDLDHDGDLDLLLVGSAGARVYRNNLDGTFTEATAALRPRRRAATRATRLRRLRRRRPHRRRSSRARAAVIALLPQRRRAALQRRDGGEWTRDDAAGRALRRSATTTTTACSISSSRARRRRAGALAQQGKRHLHSRRSLERGAAGARARAAICRRRSWTTTTTAGSTSSSARARADKRAVVFSFATTAPAGSSIARRLIPATVRAAGASAIAVSDVDDDGDEDLAAHRRRRRAAAAAQRGRQQQPRRERRAERPAHRQRQEQRVRHRCAGSSSARRDLPDARRHRSRRRTSGLGPHLKADVLRIEWPNGVPQTVYFPGTDQDVVEREMLKGSCAFAYTWDGTRFRFVTDAMWRSALGMPLGLMGGATSAFAPAGASQEYVRIPGRRAQAARRTLRPAAHRGAVGDGVRRRGQAARRRPSGFGRRVRRRALRSAGTREAAALPGRRAASCRSPRSTSAATTSCRRCATSDDVYVSNLTPTSIRESSSRTISCSTSAQTPAQPDTFLFLRGWIYPTDASINVALSQQSAIKLASPSLEVRDANGQMAHRDRRTSASRPARTRRSSIDLAGKFPTADHHVRIRTNMQIYWDQAFVARDARGQSGEGHDARAASRPTCTSAASRACIARAAATARTGSPTTT